MNELQGLTSPRTTYCLLGTGEGRVPVNSSSQALTRKDRRGRQPPPEQWMVGWWGPRHCQSVYVLRSFINLRTWPISNGINTLNTHTHTHARTHAHKTSTSARKCDTPITKKTAPTRSAVSSLMSASSALTSSQWYPGVSFKTRPPCRLFGCTQIVYHPKEDERLQRKCRNSGLIHNTCSS